MESSHPQSYVVIIQLGVDPLPHFTGSLVGKSHGKDLPGLCNSSVNNPGNLSGKHPGFPTAGTCKNKKMAAIILYCFLLIFVKCNVSALWHGYCFLLSV